VDAGAYADPDTWYCDPRITVAQGPFPYPIAMHVPGLCIPTIPIGAVCAGMALRNLFATESIMDTVAHKLGMDPVDFRLVNLSHEGEISLSPSHCVA